MTSASTLLGKSLSISSAASHPATSSQSNTSASFESTRRQGQTGPSPSQPAPRKGQGSRKQHRNQRKPGFRGPNADQDDAMAEIRAVRNASSRRGQTSITHLLNYAVPHPSYIDGHHRPHSHSSYSRSYRRNPTWGPGSGYHAADKTRYVHANYRFVVSPSGDYSSHAHDADKHLDWADVLQILASAESQQTSCPICLSEPVAPRMAKCGHVFCLPCLLRFMDSVPVGDDAPGSAVSQSRHPKWKSCPICEDTIYIYEVRPVRFYAGQESPLPRPGDDVVLRLMTRNANNTIALPREGGGTGVLNPEEDVPWHFAANVLDYARVMKGTAGYMEEQFDWEVDHLLKLEKEDELLFQEGTEWTQKAIRAVNASKEKVKGLGDAEVAVSDAAAAAAASSAQSSRQPEQDFYFYTSPPHLYLSALDIRILKTKYGSFSAFPSTLLPRVEHISTGHVVDDAVRRRAKYLGHLPHGCLISYLECDWTDIVPPEILGSFSEDIERRRKRNRDKAAQEDRERLQAERIEAATIRGARRNTGSLVDEDVTIRFSAAQAEPTMVNPDDFLPLGAQSTTPPNPRPGFAHLADVSTSPSAQRTVWGTPAVPASPDMAPEQKTQESVDDGWLRDDEFLETLGTAELAMQMEALGFQQRGDESRENPTGGDGSSGGVGRAGGEGREQSGGGSGSGGGGGVGGGRKKKKQKITLMSTGGRRGA